MSRCDAATSRVETIDAELARCWEDRHRLAQLQRERSRLRAAVEPLRILRSSIAEQLELAEMAARENAADLLDEIDAEADVLAAKLDEIRLRTTFAHPHAAEDCFIEVTYGSGGDESQDWARMLLRMYAGYADSRSWAVTIVDETAGSCGIKSGTLQIDGDYAYGHLRTETGVHRLVRLSPFDSNHRRHTTFASVFTYPVLKHEETEEIASADLRIDTYRASGAGGQHVNTTDSAVRITHLPTGTIVQCQNDRSQHKNKATALAMLRSRLQIAAERKREEHKRKLDAAKADISWGSQIRSYVLDQSRVKDLRTGVESGDPQGVLSGDGLHKFIVEQLRMQI